VPTGRVLATRRSLSVKVAAAAVARA
jgi:hypothetical protein